MPQIPTALVLLDQIASGRAYVPVAEISTLVGMAPQTLRNRSNANSASPLAFAVIKVGGQRGRLKAHVDSVREYLLLLEAQAQSALARAVASAPTPAEKGGAPTKAAANPSAREHVNRAFARGVAARTGK